MFKIIMYITDSCVCSLSSRNSFMNKKVHFARYSFTHNSGPARGFGYTVSRAISIQVYGIFWSKFGYKVFSFS